MNNQKIERNDYDTIAAVGIRGAAEHLRLPIHLRLLKSQLHTCRHIDIYDCIQTMICF